ncbi:MAG: pyruvate kinase [Nitrospirota bacterium]|nr:pyruvate kinase [Nitrospirota bacterium]
MKHRKARIVCTMGPASANRKVISTMVKEGLDVARLNFSHGDYESHKKTLQLLREISQKYNQPVSILQDLQGIKIRTGPFSGGEAELRKGSDVSIFPGSGIGNGKNVYVSYPSLLRDAKKGDVILLDDGLIQLSVVKKSRKALTAKVIEGGIIRDKKGVNFPGMKISLKAFTEKDRKDLEFGLEMNVDYVAISFVRTADDIRIIKKWLRERGRNIPIIAKIEKPAAVLNIDKILDVSDGIMIARGDLGVEVSPEKVPLIQKDLIERANIKGKIVITATQMLESMKEHLRPTRAEATDVANAVIDGTDALMLSAETAVGAYPIAAFRMMNRIIRYTEHARKQTSSYIRGSSYTGALADAACRASEDIGAKLLVAFTRSGFTARLVSKFRPRVPVIAFTPNLEVLRQMPFYWGVIPKFMKALENTDQMLREVEKTLINEKLVKKGDRIVIIASSPLSTMGKTNFMKLHQIGE